MGYDASVVIFYGIKLDADADISMALKEYCSACGVKVWDKTDFYTQKEYKAYYVGYKLREFSVCRTNDGIMEVPLQTSEMKERMANVSQIFELPGAKLWMINDASW